MRFTPPDGVLNLAQTLDCGQSFRFYPVTLENNIPAWRGVAFSRGLTVYQDENNDLVLDCTEQEFRDIWFDYFDFNTDYKKSREVLSALHPALKEAAEFAGGIRILKQEPFEALCSFIISQNNNIPRIKGIIERLCLHFGEPFLYHNETRYAFPAPKKLASCTPEDLAPLRAGFRAKYLIDAAKRIASGEIDLEAVRKMPLPDAKAKLQTISGVGPKVADCALLYGLHRTECFPMDVHTRISATKISFRCLRRKSLIRTHGLRFLKRRAQNTLCRWRSTMTVSRCTAQIFRTGTLTRWARSAI